MSRRLALAALAVFAVLAVSGCAALGGGNQPDPSRLAANATYDWNTNATVHVNVTGETEYRVVYTLSNRSTVEAYRHSELEGDQPIEVSAVKFRYPNGTVVGSERLDVQTTDGRTVFALPASDGQLAYTAPTGTKRLALPVTVSGSYELVLPAGMRVGNPLFGHVRPGGYTTWTAADRTHVHWNSLDGGTVDVQYYLQRDLYLFGGLVGLLVLVATAGVVFYRLQIRRLERRRTEAGLDVEGDDRDRRFR